MTNLLKTKDRDDCGYIIISKYDHAKFSEKDSYVNLVSYSFYDPKELLDFCKYTLLFFGWNENFSIDDCKNLLEKFPHVSTNIKKKEETLFYKWVRREKDSLNVKAGRKDKQKARKLARQNPEKNVYVISKKGKKLYRFFYNYGEVMQLLVTPMTSKQSKQWSKGKRYKWFLNR